MIDIADKKPGAGDACPEQPSDRFAAKGSGSRRADRRGHLNIPFADEDDRKFYEVAKQVNAKLITGNLKHFPEDPLVTTAADFLAWRRRFESC